ncbi:MAG TPA: HPF/RaiA family ribosome-associated protein [Edaphobacter sp.]|jgi:ribosome-associated translation inhibitor RaiA|nr:HPF/RaiA family ribosome-associated protein [Edaphobacter sp.]
MHVQINSDSTISMHNQLSDSIGAYILTVLRRFDPYLTRVEVHLTGEAKRNSQSGPRDKRCLLEARPKHHRSLIVSAESTDIDTAFAGASAKLHRLLESTYGRLDDKRRRKQKMVSRSETHQPVSVN